MVVAAIMSRRPYSVGDESGSRLRVFFDATRLLSRLNSTPTGIDRVDLAYLSALSREPQLDLRLIQFDVFGPKLLRAHQTRDLIDSASIRWQVGERASGITDKAAELLSWLGSAHGTPFSRPKRRGRQKFAVLRRTLAGESRLARSRDAIMSRRLNVSMHAERSVYLNTSHGKLFRKSVARWLRGSGIPSVFFVHDLIPIEFPQFNRASEPARHAARILTMSRYAKLILVNSKATETALKTYIENQGLRLPPILTAPLGIENRFSDGSRACLPAKSESLIPYFVVLGTIEPRKNHQLLIHVWKQLVRARGQRAPRLVILGRRGWENQHTFRLLDYSPELSEHVVECCDLGDQQVWQILKSARALLCPSFAEGFSLPVVEALASGTPVIASDIPAHREVSQRCAELLPADSRGLWQEIIQEYSHPASKRRQAQLDALETFICPTWESHFSGVIPALLSCASTS